MKKLATILNTEVKQEKDTRKQQLDEAIAKMADIKPTFTVLEKSMKESKDTIKTLCAELGYDSYEGSGLKITLSHIDKSYLEPALVLNYLKNNKLKKYIHTKEYFDEAEIAMAIANGELKAEDFGEFLVKKEELRLNIK